MFLSSSTGSAHSHCFSNCGADIDLKTLLIIIGVLAGLAISACVLCYLCKKSKSASSSHDVLLGSEEYTSVLHP